MRIGQMRTNHLTDPLGYAMKHPTFSWVVEESTGAAQKSARIRVAADAAMDALLLDTGDCAALSSLGSEIALPLQPRTRYYWTVEVTADDGDTAVSDVAWFETGKRDEPWQAKWIALPGDRDQHPVIKKVLSVGQKVKQARLYICGLGLYEAQLNGRAVTDECFCPFWDDYDHLIQYQTWDVTDQVSVGQNTIQVLLGNGWYRGRYGFGQSEECIYGDTMQMIAELHLTYMDGSEVVLCSDESWLCHASPVLFSNIYDGEQYDARLEQTSDVWRHAEVVAPPRGKLSDRISPPVGVTETLSPVQLLHTPAGELVLDFGQVVTGYVSFVCDLPAGAAVHLQYGELLQKNCFYRDNLRTAKAEYTFTSDGTARTVRPHFAYYGFRFVKVEGLSAEEIQKAQFHACVIHSRLDRIGWIVTGHEQVNKLISNALWSQRDNFLDIPTDCPQRDERMGWTGDAQVFCPTASFNMYTPAFYRKYMINMLLAQRQHDGAAPHVVPDILANLERLHHSTEPDYQYFVGGGSCAWADAAVIIPWTLYLFYGDKALLRDQYESMKLWVDYVHRKGEAWVNGFHFADWLALDNPDKNSCMGGTDHRYVAQAYKYYSTSLLSKAAAELDYASDAALYSRLADETLKDIRNEFFSGDGNCSIQTQTALVLALKLGLVPAASRQNAIAALRQRLAANGMHLDTGFVGTPMLCPVLSENGLHNDAVTLLLQEEYPGWLYEIRMGATTVWERWNSVMPDGLVSDTGMNSMNHYAYGSVVEWIYRYLAGLNPDALAPGFRHAVIRPMPDRRLGSLKAEYLSAAGRYCVEWEYAGNKVEYRITVPFGCCADVILPDGTRQALSAGRYTLSAVQESC